MWGDKSKDVLKVKKTILNAMEDMNFHRLQLMIGENVGLTALRNATELAQSATADGQVGYFIYFTSEDFLKSECAIYKSIYYYD